LEYLYVTPYGPFIRKNSSVPLIETRGSGQHSSLAHLASDNAYYMQGPTFEFRHPTYSPLGCISLAVRLLDQKKKKTRGSN